MIAAWVDTTVMQVLLFLAAVALVIVLHVLSRP